MDYGSLPSLGSGERYYDECRFADFIVAPSNRDAYHACQQVAANPGAFANPLLIAYQRTGDGGTLLTAATGNAIASNGDDRKVIMLGADLIVRKIDFLAEKWGDLLCCKAFIIDHAQVLLDDECSMMFTLELIQIMIKMGIQTILNVSDASGAISAIFEKHFVHMNAPYLITRIGRSEANLHREKLLNAAKKDGISLCDKVIEALISQNQGGVRALEGKYRLYVCKHYRQSSNS